MRTFLRGGITIETNGLATPVGEKVKATEGSYLGLPDRFFRLAKSGLFDGGRKMKRWAGWTAVSFPAQPNVGRLATLLASISVLG